MDEHQKTTFSPDAEGLCRLCKKPDSLEHKILLCDATELVRTEFPEVVDFLFEHDLIHTHLPVIFMLPDWEFDRCLHYHTPTPTIAVKLPTPKNFSLYTDGSCQFPSLPNRWTAFSVVQPIVDEQTILDSSHLPIQQICDSCFRVVAVAQGRGHQTIPRAELQALIVAFQHDAHSRVVSDSAYALDTLEKVTKAENINDLHKLPNFDLLQELFELVSRSSIQLIGVKVKAHEEFHTSNSQVTLDRIGNAVADFVANTACKELGGQQATWRRGKTL